MSSQDPFAQFREQSVSAPPPVLAAPSASTDPFADFRSAKTAEAPAPVSSENSAFSQPAALSAPSSQGSDPFAQFRTAPKAAESEEPESTTWYGKSWDWLNKPTIDLHRDGATGFE